ncbi:hypothetical protein FQN57_003776 [Myotisia sp. PD_48]|nr:hypothetical protein FQN57_003776 [Myotisia sp. PD_48]
MPRLAYYYFLFLSTSCLAGSSSPDAAITRGGADVPLYEPISMPSTIAPGTSLPTLILDDRGVVEQPPGALPTKPTQVSPVMTMHIDGKPVLYTQKFSAIPDQWPTPASGSIGYGTLKKERTSTFDKRSEPTDITLLSLSRCRTNQCRARILKAVEKNAE